MERLLRGLLGAPVKLTAVRRRELTQSPLCFVVVLPGRVAYVFRDVREKRSGKVSLDDGVKEKV